MHFEKLAFRQLGFVDEEDKALFSDLEFEFPLNEIVQITGDAGSGKSLLLKLMGGLRLPTSGHYEINGQNVSELNFNQFLPYRLAIGFGFEQGGLLGNKTVRQNLRLPMEYHRLVSEDEADKRVDELIELFNIRDLENYRPYELSGSYKRLCVVARALVLRPSLLLLDHPSTGLSNADRLKLADLLKEEKTSGHVDHVFFISNQDTFANSMATSQIEIREGSLHNVQVS